MAFNKRIGKFVKITNKDSIKRLIDLRKKEQKLFIKEMRKFLKQWKKL